MFKYYSGDREIPKVDEDFAKFITWLMDNTTERERDLIYVTEKYTKAWLTASEIRMGGKPNIAWTSQLEKVNKSLDRLGYPLL